MIPKGLPVKLFIQTPDKITCVLGRDIECDLCQIQIRSNAAGGGNSGSGKYVLQDPLRQGAGIGLVQRQVIGDI